MTQIKRFRYQKLQAIASSFVDTALGGQYLSDVCSHICSCSKKFKFWFQLTQKKNKTKYYVYNKLIAHQKQLISIFMAQICALSFFFAFVNEK